MKKNLLSSCLIPLLSFMVMKIVCDVVMKGLVKMRDDGIDGSN